MEPAQRAEVPVKLESVFCGRQKTTEFPPSFSLGEMDKILTASFLLLGLHLSGESWRRNLRIWD